MRYKLMIYRLKYSCLFQGSFVFPYFMVVASTLEFEVLTDSILLRKSTACTPSEPSEILDMYRLRSNMGLNQTSSAWMGHRVIRSMVFHLGAFYRSLSDKSDPRLLSDGGG